MIRFRVSIHERERRGKRTRRERERIIIYAVGHYDSLENRKKYFFSVAEGQGLQPDNMEEWYSLSTSFIFHNVRFYPFILFYLLI